jgi:Rrf2 family transcriptional regulator, cysteine metabolism repressor
VALDVPVAGSEMKVSSKSRYALMALVELDLRTRGSGRPVRLTDLARERGIPEQFLEQLFAGLRRAGLLAGRRGVGGGFTFARRPDQLTVLDVVEALDGTLDADGGSADWGVEERAAGGAVWLAAGEAYQGVLARTTVSDLTERERLQGAGGPMYEI